ncbi:MAG TPA: DNA methyltransferase [Candidatus Limnocylindria bacterium]|nr:DNA methyltransferase [Candidatus Limnocylindria bacterium]
MQTNVLYYGDNLEVLRKRIATESVDLVYLDPPFNSKRSYNVLFGHKTGEDAQAQIEAFDDSWTWSQESDGTYRELIAGGAPAKVADMIEGMRRLLGETDMLAYLVMMTPRLVELHRALKTTGSLYLHCDPVASHYLKVILDALFGPEHFKNEIIWRRTGAHGKVRRWAPIHQVILFYTKSDTYKWNDPKRPYMRGHVSEYFVKDDKGWRTNYYGNVLTGSGLRGGESGKPWRGFDPSAKNRHWAIPSALTELIDEDLSGLSQHQKLDRLYELGHIKIVPGEAWPMYERYLRPEDGAPVPDIWAYEPYTQGTVFGTEEGIDEDVRWLAPRDPERLGYETQKPVALLKRIIAASSDPGDVVLDPFCGCGTTVEAAQELDRKWMGIDITYIAIDLIEKRLRHRYGDDILDRFEVDGIPRDLAGARALFARSPFDFERWAVSRVDGTPNEKQVGDRGVDGVVRFPVDSKGGVGRALVSVKGGATNPGHVRDLLGTIETQRADIGILVTLEAATRGIQDAARHSGSFEWPVNGKAYPKVQVLTVEQLLDGAKPNMPTPLLPYIKAQRGAAGTQLSFGDIPQSDGEGDDEESAAIDQTPRRLPALEAKSAARSRHAVGTHVSVKAVQKPLRRSGTGGQGRNARKAK